MPGTDAVAAMVLASIGIVLIPGSGNFFILAQGVAGGRSGAMAAVVGMAAASAARIAATAAGLTALVSSSAIAFGIVKGVGVVYLLHLAVRAFRSELPAAEFGRRQERPSRWSIMLRGFVVGVLNVKLAIFFVAYFPQFVDPQPEGYVVRVLVLGGIYWAIGVLWDVAFAQGCGSIGQWMGRRPGLRQTLPRVEGCVYLALVAWSVV